MINLFDRAVAHFKEHIQTLTAENNQLRAEATTLQEQLAEANAYRTESAAVELWKQKNHDLEMVIEAHEEDRKKLQQSYDKLYDEYTND